MSFTRKTHRPRLLYEDLKDRIYKELVKPLLGTGGRLPSNRQLAQDLNANSATISKALQELEKEGLLTKQVGAGTFVPARKNCPAASVGLYYGREVFDGGKESAFVGELDSGLQRELSRMDRSCRHYVEARLPEFNTAPLPLLEDEVSSRKISSIITLGGREPQRAWLSKLPIPIISLEHDFGWGKVRFDFSKAGFDAASILAARGCRNIRILSVYLHEWSISDTSPSTPRLLRAGMVNALSPHGIAAPEPLSAEDLPDSCRKPGESPGAEEAGRELFKNVWARHHPDGIVVFTDIFAVGVARAIEELGLELGKDIHAVMLTNKQLRWPELERFTRLELSIEEIARGLVDLAAAAESNAPPRAILVEFKDTSKKMNISEIDCATSSKRSVL